MRLPKYLILIVFVSGLLISSCGPSESEIQSAIAETKFAEQSLTPESTSTQTHTNKPTTNSTATNTQTPTTTFTPIITLTPTITFTPTVTLSPTITGTPTMTPTATSMSVGKAFICGKYFTIAVMEPPIFASVLEDNPPYYPFYGKFMIVNIRLVNNTDSPRWVWYSDYYMHGLVNGKPVLYQLDGVDDPSHALIKLYKTNDFQVEIGPRETYDTMVAFDVNPAGEKWELTVMPDQLCSVKIPLEIEQD